MTNLSSTSQISAGLVLPRNALPEQMVLPDHVVPLRPPYDGDTAHFVDIDQEWQTPTFEESYAAGRILLREGVTFQGKAAFMPRGMMFCHTDLEQYARKEGLTLRHPVWRSDFAILDYYQACGVPLTMERLPSMDHREHYPDSSLWVIYFHFGVVELRHFAKGAYLQDLEQKTLEGYIDQKKRVRAYQAKDPHSAEFVEMPWLAVYTTPEGVRKKKIDLMFVDTAALHGPASLKDIAANVGVDLPDKSSMDHLKSRMRDAYFSEHSETDDRFENYGLGDLKMREILLAFRDKLITMYKDTGVVDHFRGEGRMTFGATVKDFITAHIYKANGIKPGNLKGQKAFRQNLLQYGTAKYLQEQVHDAYVYMAKVIAGRCFNARSRHTKVFGPLFDIDIASCYGRGLLLQDLFFGQPIFLNYRLRNKQQKLPSLRAFLAEHAFELVPGAWSAVVSLEPGYRLTYPQDFFPSHYNIQKLRALNDTDEDDIDPENPLAHLEDTNEEESYDPHIGNVKIFRHDIQHSILTHDSLQWIMTQTSKEQRTELLDHLQIVTAGWYPADTEVKNLQEWQKAKKPHAGVSESNVTRKDGLPTHEEQEQEFHGWYRINFGTLVIKALLQLRKNHMPKTPLNQLYKLFVNCSYGVLVSTFFEIGNVIAANNVTQRCRLLCWCMEKGLFAHQSITDGAAFNPNTVVYPTEGRRLTAVSVVHMDIATKRTLDRNHHLELRPLDDVDVFRVEFDGIRPRLFITKDGHTTIKEGVENPNDPDQKPHDEIHPYIEDAAMRHLTNLYGELDIFKNSSFNFEVKDVFDGGTFHSAGLFHSVANYRFTNRKKPVLKMRAQEKRLDAYQAMIGDTPETLRPDPTYKEHTPSELFFDGLETPDDMPRLPMFVKTRILMIPEWRKQWESTYKSSVISFGENTYIAQILHEFNLGQFPCETIAQWKKLNKEIQYAHDHYGQSVEMFFVKPNGNLDYQEMVETVDRLIRGGCTSLFKALEDRRTFQSEEEKYHPAFKTLQLTKAWIKKAQQKPTTSEGK